MLSCQWMQRMREMRLRGNDFFATEKAQNENTTTAMTGARDVMMNPIYWTEYRTISLRQLSHD
jgi:hypothetical protein